MISVIQRQQLKPNLLLYLFFNLPVKGIIIFKFLPQFMGVSLLKEKYRTQTNEAVRDAENRN